MISTQRTLLISLVALFALLSWRQHEFVDRYAVDVFYWDSWDLYYPMFSGHGWWTSFDFQHGPHRQGLGGLLMRFLANHSRWNARWDAFSVSFSLIAAAAMGIWLAVRSGVRGWALLAVPLIFLNIRQCHMFIASANPSHGALPVLLLMLCSLAMFIPIPPLRLGLTSVLTFLLIFTGFGIFAGIVMPMLLSIELIQVFRGNDPQRRVRINCMIAALLVIAASWALFGYGYHFDPAAPGFRFPYEHPIEYLYFIGAMFGNFFGLDTATPLAVAVGSITFLATLCICAFHGVRVARNGFDRSRPSAVIFFLSTFSLVYCMNAAVGRTFLGWQTGALSRYVTLMIPMAFALLLHLATTPMLATRGLAIIYGLLLALGTCTLHQVDMDATIYLHNRCMLWRLAYLQTHDQTAADRLANFPIYPGKVGNRLHYLEVLKLNLFDPNEFTSPEATHPAE